VYPESAPENWIDTLRDEHIPALISPLHSDDISADGTPKKEHFHVMLMFENAVPASKASSVFQKIGVSAPPELIHTMRGYARYLCHLDDHDKASYNPGEVQEISGANWAELASDKAEETDRILDEIEEFIDEMNIVSYRYLCRYARHERPEWKRTVRSNSIHLKEYLKAVVWESLQD
jgi:hypothetical protein